MKGRLGALAKRIASCTACPRLVAHREHVARTKRRAYADETYWGRPVAGFGDPQAPLVIVGLAPGAHGANRTGRPFTGDRSGDFLYAALHRAGLASQPTAVSRDDGLRLRGVFITLPVRCVPPGNLPSRDEIDRCADWFEAEIALLERARCFLTLGRIAFDAVQRLAGGGDPRPAFSHGARSELAWPGRRQPATLVASYHVSQQNTQTGRLTAAMFDAVLGEAAAAAGLNDRA